ncbi:AMP-binding protein [Salinibacterium sp. ZJ450]|uniref:AMP-binding protein n=1 Tax=Salinibacterium sp. ZJ450 TaxID=2708338 RepID=UPI0014245855|nr:AMP-binding protein [Salinibacterium sp. ZJ450]
MVRGLVEAIAATAERVGAGTTAVSTLDAAGGASHVLTYRQLLEESERVAAGFAELGLRVGDTIAVFLPNVSQWLVTELAAARAGLIVAPINTKYRSSEVARILSVNPVRAAVVATGFLGLDLAGILDAALADQADRDQVRVIEVPLGHPTGRPGVILFEELGAQRQPRVPAPLDPDRPLNLLFSSGTTSSPKTVAHGQRSLMTRLGAAGERLDIHPGDVVLCALPICGAWGLSISLATLVAGAGLLLAPTFNGDVIARAVGDHRVTHFHGGDDMVRSILDSPELNPARAAAWRSATFGNFSGKDTADLVSPRPGLVHLEVSGAYGSSEALPFIAVDPPGAPPAHRASAGGPLVDRMTEARVVDPDTGSVCAEGASGELLLRGTVVAKEYVGNPAATADAFDDEGWFHTGDLAQITAEGRVVFLGRLRDSLRIRGFLVDPGEIEEFLTSVPGVAAAQVVGVLSPPHGDVPVAFIVRSNHDAEDGLEERVLAACRAGLAAFKAPVAVIVVESFPSVDGPNGPKVKRQDLQEMARAVVTS